METLAGTESSFFGHAEICVLLFLAVSLPLLFIGLPLSRKYCRGPRDRAVAAVCHMLLQLTAFLLFLVACLFKDVDLVGILLSLTFEEYMSEIFGNEGIGTLEWLLLAPIPFVILYETLRLMESKKPSPITELFFVFVTVFPFLDFFSAKDFIYMYWIYYLINKVYMRFFMPRR